MRFRRKLPSLNALVALEATIRHRSFTEAAKELGVTQAAVSRQIALLEADFGRPLFARGHRSIEPTPACLILGNALEESFAKITDSVEAIRGNLAADVVTIGSTIAFSSLWLLPKLAGFRELNPTVHIRVVSQETKLDLGHGGIDIAIRYGSPPFNDASVIASCGDRLFPVCAPAYAKSRQLDAFPDGNYELIETDVQNRSWYRWEDWFAALGIKSPRGRPMLRFSHYTETVAAARAGQGIALGWETLVFPHLADGTLIKVGERQIEAEGSYNVLVPNGAKLSPAAELTAGWLTGLLQSTPLVA